MSARSRRARVNPTPVSDVPSRIRSRAPIERTKCAPSPDAASTGVTTVRRLVSPRSSASGDRERTVFTPDSCHSHPSWSSNRKVYDIACRSPSGNSESVPRRSACEAMPSASIVPRIVTGCAGSARNRSMLVISAAKATTTRGCGPRVVIRSWNTRPSPLVEACRSDMKVNATSSGTSVGTTESHSGARHPCWPERRITRSIDRSATARIVADGFTPVAAGSTEPSITNRPGYPCTSQASSTTPVLASGPGRTPPNG